MSHGREVLTANWRLLFVELSCAELSWVGRCDHAFRDRSYAAVVIILQLTDIHALH